MKSVARLNYAVHQHKNILDTVIRRKRECFQPLTKDDILEQAKTVLENLDGKAADFVNTGR